MIEISACHMLYVHSKFLPRTYSCVADWVNDNISVWDQTVIAAPVKRCHDIGHAPEKSNPLM